MPGQIPSCRYIHPGTAQQSGQRILHKSYMVPYKRCVGHNGSPTSRDTRDYAMAFKTRRADRYNKGPLGPRKMIDGSNQPVCLVCFKPLYDGWGVSCGHCRVMMHKKCAERRIAAQGSMTVCSQCRTTD
jgi:hypothetical protein